MKRQDVSEEWLSVHYYVFFNDTTATEIYTLSLHDALPISRTLVYRLAEWYARRTYGVVPDPLAAMAHHRRVLLTDVRFETSLARWDRLDRTLKSLAVMASAMAIGCSWCVDFGHWISTQEGVDPAKLRAVPHWRKSDLFTDLERREIAPARAGEANPPPRTHEDGFPHPQHLVRHPPRHPALMGAL